MKDFEGYSNILAITDNAIIIPTNTNGNVKILEVGMT
jgi:hypothetical protein